MFIGNIQATGRMTVTIGAGGVRNFDGGETTIENSSGQTVYARGGQSVGYGNGGNGWSGGGAWGGAGGHNGGDGKDYQGRGGKGQHMALPSIAGVLIEAGAGGQSCFLEQCLGGGGGGLIINGDGKRSDTRAAQGYGSGSGDYGSGGKSGAVILYF